MSEIEPIDEKFLKWIKTGMLGPFTGHTSAEIKAVVKRLLDAGLIRQHIENLRGTRYQWYELAKVKCGYE